MSVGSAFHARGPATEKAQPGSGFDGPRSCHSRLIGVDCCRSARAEFYEIFRVDAVLDVVHQRPCVHMPNICNSSPHLINRVQQTRSNNNNNNSAIMFMAIGKAIARVQFIPFI